MSVFRRPSGRWVAQIYDPATKRSRQVGTYSTRKDAKVAEALAVARTATGGEETIQSFAARWMRDYPRARESTNQHNTERVKRFAATFSRRRMDSITSDEARAWVIVHGSSHSALRAMFNDARRSGLVIVNPFADLRLPRSRGRRDLESDWLTVDDVDRLSTTARNVHGDYGPMMASLVTFAAFTGIRPGELFALRFDDLRVDTVHVRRSADSKTRTIGPPKNGLPREIVYPAPARRAVESAPRFYEQQLVFVAPRGGQIWAPHFNWLWNPVRAAFGRPTMHFYELRHFCATHLLELGLSPSDVAVQLGHTDNGKLVMSTYGHPSVKAARARILTAIEGHDTGEIADLRRRREGM